jgi:Family of unknown function (DUF5681)
MSERSGVKVPQNRHKSGFDGPSPDVGKATQFKPGQSGNPGGRPKSRIITEAYNRELVKPANDNSKPRTKLEQVAQAQVKRALKGDTRAAKEITDRVEGTAVQSVQISGQTDITAGRSTEEMEFFLEHGDWPEEKNNA